MFESTLIASRRQKTPRQRLLALPVAIALHLVAVSGFVVAQLVTAGPVPEPVVWAEFCPVPLPQMPPPTDGGGRKPQANQQRRSETPQPRTAVVQPAEIPSESARPGEPEVAEEPTGLERIDITGFFIGRNGESGGGGRWLGPGNDSPAEDPPITLTADVAAPVLIHRVDPVYPDVAIKTKTQGVVVLEAIIDRAGEVVGVEVLRDIGMGCGNAALQAVRQWRYRPATLNGRAVAVYLTVTVRFELH